MPILVLFLLAAALVIIGLTRSAYGAAVCDAHGRSISLGDRVISTVTPHEGTVVAIILDTPGAPIVHVHWDPDLDLPTRCSASTLLRVGAP